MSLKHIANCANLTLKEAGYLTVQHLQNIYRSIKNINSLALENGSMYILKHAINLR